MKDPDGKEDYHYILTGAITQAPPQLYRNLLAAIIKTSFLKVQQGDEKSGLLKVVSDRTEDPRGIIEIKIMPHLDLHDGSRLFVMVNDEEFLQAFYGGGQLARYAAGTLIGLLPQRMREDRFSTRFE